MRDSFPGVPSDSIEATTWCARRLVELKRDKERLKTDREGQWTAFDQKESWKRWQILRQGSLPLRISAVIFCRRRWKRLAAHGYRRFSVNTKSGKPYSTVKYSRSRHSSFTMVTVKDEYDIKRDFPPPSAHSLHIT